MNWSEFNDVVRTYLLVDSERKGRGVQDYIARKDGTYRCRSITDATIMRSI